MAPKGQPHIGAAPQDGRDWMTADEAATASGMKRKCLLRRARRLKFTLYYPPDHSQTWLLREEIEAYNRFLEERERWRKKRRPANWRPQTMDVGDEEVARRIFLTTKQAAAILGVTPHTVAMAVLHGKLAAHPSRGTGSGSLYWFSRTAVKAYLEDEERLKGRDNWKKAMEIWRQRRLGIEAGKPPTKPRVYPGVPKGWLSIRQAAERLGVSEGRMYRMRKRGAFFAEQFPGKGRTSRTWFIHENAIEELLKDEDYQACRQRWEKANGIVTRPAK